MAESNLRALTNAKFTEAKFRPFAQAIGQSALAWNDLHEHLGRLFAMMLKDLDWGQQLAVWQSSKSDRGKRDMLKAAIRNLPANLRIALPKLPENVEWLLVETDALEDRRNNVVHVPLHLVVEMDAVPSPATKSQLLAAAEVQPHDWARNIRAGKMASKHVLGEYRACREHAVVLKSYCRALCEVVVAKRLSRPSHGWPRRPTRPIVLTPKGS